VQAKVMQIMPIAFSVLFIFFPSGLVLYWLGQQHPADRAAMADEPAAGEGSGAEGGDPALASQGSAAGTRAATATRCGARAPDTGRGTAKAGHRSTIRASTRSATPFRRQAWCLPPRKRAPARRRASRTAPSRRRAATQRVVARARQRFHLATYG
jgi:hypothetical protein